MIRRRHRRDPERLRWVLSLPSEHTSCAPLLAAVGDVSLDVARAALHRLAPLAGPPEIDALRSQMLELDIGIVGDVAAALRELGDAVTSGVAVAALQDESGFKRQKAAVALRELRDPKTRAPLHAALDDREAAVRRSSVEALGRLVPNPDTSAVLKPMLHDRDPFVRATTVTALAGVDELAAASLRPAVVDPHASVRRAAATGTVVAQGSSPRVSPASRFEPETVVTTAPADGSNARPAGSRLSSW
jgi:HEAT repeat protein